MNDNKHLGVNCLFVQQKTFSVQAHIFPTKNRPFNWLGSSYGMQSVENKKFKIIRTIN